LIVLVTKIREERHHRAQFNKPRRETDPEM